VSEKIKLQQAVIVEGRYDKIKLAGILDAFIVETNGFGIFNDKAKLAFIRKLARERGIILLTDSDHAGFMIRRRIASSVPQDRLVNVYIPDVYGKEKRKETPSKEGKLGVEGMTKEVLLAAFENAGVTASLSENDNPVTKADLFDAGFSGTPDAKNKRKKLLARLDLPEFLSANSLLSCINNMMTKEEFVQLVSTIE